MDRSNGAGDAAYRATSGLGTNPLNGDPDLLRQVIREVLAEALPGIARPGDRPAPARPAPARPVPARSPGPSALSELPAPTAVPPRPPTSDPAADAAPAPGTDRHSQANVPAGSRSAFVRPAATAPAATGRTRSPATAAPGRTGSPATAAPGRTGSPATAAPGRTGSPATASASPPTADSRATNSARSPAEGGPAGASDAGTGSWTVRLSTDEDLHAFVLRVLRLADNPKLRGDLISGRARFRLAAQPDATAASPAHRVDKGAVTERAVNAAAKAGARLVLGPRAVLTPLARDKARALGVPIEKER